MHGINNSRKIQEFLLQCFSFGISGVKKRISATFDDLTLYIYMDSPFVLKTTKLSPTFPTILLEYRLTI
jgi:hypothetical protein